MYMKRNTVRHFHTRLIVTLAGAAITFLGFLEFALSKSFLSSFIAGFGYSMVLIGILVLRPRYSLSIKIAFSFGLLFVIISMNLIFSLLRASTPIFVPSPISWLGLLIILFIFGSSFTIVFVLPTTIQNLLKLFALENIRNLIISFVGIYISFILFFAFCFANVYKFIPDSFGASQSLSFFDITYYSVVTITTLGYGDIRALHWVSKLLSMIEVIIGLGLVVIYVGITASIILRESFQGSERANKEKK